MESAEELFGQIRLASLQINNTWKVRQDDRSDSRTSHIYKCRTIADLDRAAAQKDLTPDECLYAVHRWRNFKRHEAWLSLLFEQVPSIGLSQDRFNKTEDFFIETATEMVPFDLKVTRVPFSASPNLSDAQLADWFYLNQSTQGRFHLENRFFVVGEPESALYDLRLGRITVSAFVEAPTHFRHFVRQPNGKTSRAVVLRQTQLPN